MSLDRPRLRRDLEVTPIEVDGQRYVDVRDPTTGGSFRFYDFEYRVALAFDGLAFDQVIPWLRWVAGIECQAAELQEFAARLHDMGFLESSPTGVAVAPSPPQSERPAPEPGADEAWPASDEAAGSPIDAASAAPTLAEVERLPPLPADRTTPSPDELVVAVSPRATAAAESGSPAVAPAPAPVAYAEVTEAMLEEEVRPAPVWPSAADVAPSAPAADEPGAAETLDGYAPAVAEDSALSERRAVATRDGFAAAADEVPEAVEDRPSARLATRMAAVGSDEEAGVPPAWQEAAAAPVMTAAAEVAEPPPSAESAGAAPVALSEVVMPEEAAPEASEAAEARVPEEAAAEAVVETAASEPAAEHEAVAAAPEPDAAAAFPAEPDVAPAGTGDKATGAPEPEAPIEQVAVAADPALPLAAEVAIRSEVAREAEVAWPKHPPIPPSEARHLDSSAFPVLPTPPPQAVSSPQPPPSRTPPVRPLPPSYLTPPPSTLGPLRTAQQAAERRHQRRSLLLFGSLGVLAAVALIAVAGPFLFPGRSTPHAEVRTVIATPGTVLRYYGGGGLVTTMPGAVLKFPAGGTVTRIAKAGSVVAMGDVLAAVEAARPLLAQLARQRERLAFYQQIADTMHQVGNTAEEEKNAANVELRKAKIAKTLRALAQVAVVAGTAGEVEETYIREGETVEAGGLALKMRSPGHRAMFELSRSEAAEARRLGFCQANVDGYVLACKQAQEPDDETHLSVDITALPLQLVGRPARLARARYVGAVVLPASAVQSAGRRHHVLVVSAFGRIETRPVTVAEQNTAEAIVVQGLDSGENVVVEPTSDLRPGMPVKVRSN